MLKKTCGSYRKDILTEWILHASWVRWVSWCFISRVIANLCTDGCTKPPIVRMGSYGWRCSLRLRVPVSRVPTHSLYGGRSTKRDGAVFFRFSSSRTASYRRSPCFQAAYRNRIYIPCRCRRSKAPGRRRRSPTSRGRRAF